MQLIDSGLRMSAYGGSALGGKYELLKSYDVEKQVFCNIFFFLFLSADQFSKYLIRRFGGFYICNKGIAFGIELPTVLICAFAIILCVSFYLFQSSNSKIQISNKIQHRKYKFLDLIYWKFIGNWKLEIGNFYPVILILSGGLSNIIDRIGYGCVIDFIDLKFWPIFNLADVFITIGVILLIMQNLRIKRNN